MPVQSRWLVEGQVIYTELVGDLTLEDIQAGSQGVIDLLEASNLDTVHLVGDQSKMGDIPVSLKLFNDAAEFMRHDKMGWFMMYPSENKFAKFIASMISSLTKVQHRQCVSLEECLTTLKRMDDTLPSVDEMIAEFA